MWLRALAGASFSFLAASLHAASPSKVQFNRDIRPILSDNCFHCHGPGEHDRKGSLRLDVKDSALRPAKSGAVAIVPGKPEQSELVARVFTADSDDVMPPPDSEKKLTSDQKELLRQWIAEGAEYQGHWAFIAPGRPPVPAIDGGANPIDAFIRERLKSEGLAPAPEAGRATLIRRVSLDLTGLPPTPEEVEAFEKDSSPRAYEKVVDRLLASEHYGERMAMQWMDFARYADSHGFQTDSSRSMWPWRDWVIRAFNENKPFDQFTIEQLAGDLLPNPTLDQLVATGFHRNHRINGEGGIIPEEWRIENIMDRVETTGLTWLGLTLNCCRCHDHKYDPISQKEFYQLFSFFNNVPESGTIIGTSNRSGGNPDPFVRVPNAEQRKKAAELETAVKNAEQEAAKARAQIPALLAAWETSARDQLKAQKSTWKLLKPEQVQSKGGATLTVQPDGTYLAGGTNPPKDTYIYDAPLPQEGVSAFLLECFPDPSLPNQSLGRYPNGNFVLTDFDVFIRSSANAKSEKLTLSRVEADYSQKGYEIGNVLKRNRGKGWAIDGPTKREPRKALFVMEKSIAPAPGAMLLLRLRHEAITGHNIGRFRISTAPMSVREPKLEGDGGVGAVLAVLETPAAKRTPAQQKQLQDYFVSSVDGPVKRATDALSAKRAALDAFSQSLPTTMVMRELDTPRETHVLKRGEYDKPGDVVTAALPAVLPPMPKGAPMNRLGLAQWIVDPSNPLTARVWINRAWERFFGTGIVKTTENMGSQAEWPMHPELLDWLASDFMRCGWDMKAMQKLMVMSATYRQSSRITPEMQERDPDNRLLARGPRFRLAGEMVRDQALAISGLLVPKIGGPSVRPYMPEGVWDETSKYGDLRGYRADSGEGLYRRTMYTIWKRTAAPPTMLLFDSPSREVCAVKRSRTNTPLQALAMLNEVTFVEAARVLGQRMIREGGAAPADRIAWAFRRATGRSPNTEEIAVLEKGLRSRMERFRRDQEAAGQLIRQGSALVDPSLDAAELAAYTVTANVILNLDEVVTRE